MVKFCPNQWQRHELIRGEALTTIFLAQSNARTIFVSFLVILFTIISNLNIITCSSSQFTNGAGRSHGHHHNHHNHHHHHHHHHDHNQQSNERRHQRAINMAFEQPQSSKFNLTSSASSAWAHQQDQPPILDQCCACDEAKYELVFEGLWSKYTHPDDFPENYWLAHFSDIIGASHSNDFRMWGQDLSASEGVRELAETGATKKLESELKQVSSKTRTIIKARELRYPTLNSKTSAVFRTDKHHHLVSILSKLGPSPDWMVGVSGLELCQTDCTWAGQRIVNLYLWDAGTDSGDTFTSPESPTRPQERIRPYRRTSAAQLSSQTNATMHSLFESVARENSNGNNQAMGAYDQATLMQFGADQQQSNSNSADRAVQTKAELNQASGIQAALNNFNANEVMKPFARLTITRQRIYEKSCNSIEPAIGAYNPRLGASNQANHAGQHQQQSHYRGHSAGTGVSYETIKPPPQPSYSDCRFSEWTDWSSCSSTCGKGIRTRTRSHIDDQAELAGCSSADLIEKEICLSDCLANGTTCVTRDWSEWSKCSVDCGQGYRKRTRTPIGPMRPACGSIELAESEQCTGSCSQEEPVPSHCAVTEWSEWSECPVACGTGTRIRFRQLSRKEDAKSCNIKLIQKQPCTGRPELCKQVSKDSRSTPDGSAGQQSGIAPRINPDLPVIDCKLSNWSPWSTCSALCGNGRRTRSRFVIQMPQNGGKACDKKLTRTQRCKDLPPCPIDYSQQNGPKALKHNSHHNNNNNNNNNNNHHQQYQHKSTSSVRKETHQSATSTGSPGNSMNDDEDDGKFSRLLKSDAGHLQLTGWTGSTESYIADGIIAPTEMELLGSSSFQIKNGFIYPFNERDRRQLNWFTQRSVDGIRPSL